MTRQDRIAYMLEELGEGWEDARLFYPAVRNGWVLVAYSGRRYHALFEEPATGHGREDLAPRQAADEPRTAVDALLMSAHRRHEEHAEVLKSAEAARGWREPEADADLQRAVDDARWLGPTKLQRSVEPDR